MRNVAVVGLLGLVLLSSGCAFGYKKAAEAAMSPLGVRAQAQDQRLKVQLRAAILANQELSGLLIMPDVVMQRGFVVGFVDNDQQAAEIAQAGQSVGGLVSLTTYLPVKPTTESSSDDLEIKASIKAKIAVEPALVSDRYTIEVLDGVAVILGATMTQDEADEVGQIASQTSGVKEVKNYLLPVEAPYSSFRPHLR